MLYAFFSEIMTIAMSDSVSCLCFVTAGDDCKAYTDQSYTYHIPKTCSWGSFCCGSCYNRYCCSSRSIELSEDEQDDWYYIFLYSLIGTGLPVSSVRVDLWDLNVLTESGFNLKLCYCVTTVEEILLDPVAQSRNRKQFLPVCNDHCEANGFSYGSHQKSYYHHEINLVCLTYAVSLFGKAYHLGLRFP